MLDFHPLTVIGITLVLLVTKSLLATVGRSRVDSYAFFLYCQVAPKFGHTKLGELAEKTSEAHRIAKERKSISAQDHYAKWTKLNRQFDKVNGEIATLKEEVLADKKIISSYISTFLTFALTVPLWFSRVWYRKLVLFYLPAGVFPYILERAFALPFMVVGTVGLSVWMFSVNSVISSLTLMVTFPFQEKLSPPEKKVQETK